VTTSRDDQPGATVPTGPGGPTAVRHALEDQEVLWDRFLAMARAVVDSLGKSIDALCNGRLDVIPAIKDAEQESDREEVRIEQECMRILALYEPVASDLRRLATVMKVSRDWERIADLAARIARRSRKLVGKFAGVPIPEPLKSLACDVFSLVRATYDALAGRDTELAQAIIEGERSIDRQYHRLRKELKEGLRQSATQVNAWLQLLGTARNLERIADHATDIAQMVVYLEKGIIVRHRIEAPSPPP
jgi:phosphate transport system protein